MVKKVGKNGVSENGYGDSIHASNRGQLCDYWGGDGAQLFYQLGCSAH